MSSKTKKRTKSKVRHILTIYFDSKTAVENFKVWYSNSGEQDWIHVKKSDEACPKCEFDDENILNTLWEDKNLKTLKVTCSNCDHAYSVNNPYFIP